MMTPELDAVCVALSPVYANMVRVAIKDPLCWQAECFERSHLPQYLREYDTHIQRWPIIITKEHHEQFGETAKGLVRLLRQVLSRAFGSDLQRARDYLRLAPAFPLQEMLTHPNGIDYCICRVDFALTQSGLKLLEFNMGPGIGGWEISMFEGLYRNDRLLRGAFVDNATALSTLNPMIVLIRHAIFIGRKHLGDLDRDATLTVAIAVPTKMALLAQELASSRRGWAGGGTDPSRILCFCKDTPMQLCDNSVRIDGCPVHVVIDLTDDDWVQKRLLASFKLGKLLLVNSPAPIVLGNKCAVALLSEMAESGLLGREEKTVVDAVVPWTRRVVAGGNLELLGESRACRDMLLKHQAHLVLKPDDNRCGNGVVLGARASTKSWTAAVDHALGNGHYIVQEYCPPRRFPAPHDGRVQWHDLAWSVFIFGDAFAGSYVRMMPSSDVFGVINCYRGASEAIVFQH